MDAPYGPEVKRSAMKFRAGLLRRAPIRLRFAKPPRNGS